MVQTIVSAVLLLAALGGVAQARAFPPDGKQAADVQAPEAQTAAASTVALPPKITYEGGQLTVVAENALLSDVMNALHAVLGADIDLPSGASSERVWARLGPGPARKVLSDLLSGTDLNFVIQGSATDADGIRSVLLTPHTDSTPGASGPGPVADTPARMAMRRFQGARPETEPAPENPAPAVETPVTPTATDSTPAAAPSVPVATTAPTAPTASDSASAMGDIVAHPSPPASPTQENISQQLLSMYEQRRQLNQRGVPVPPINTAPPQ